MSESLFSLELHVESVDRVKVSCVIPAVSFRLLDYPTLIIHAVSPSSAQKLLQKSRIQGIPKEHIQAELRDRYGSIPFQKGKSCLFKASIANLQQQLKSTPLYVMLIDLWHQKPKLIGSTVISLSDAVSKISSDVNRFGISVPSVCQVEGTFDIFNLMGSVIGKINLSFRLLSLGGSLMSHIPSTSVMTRKGKEEIDKGRTITNHDNVSLEIEEKNIEDNDLNMIELTKPDSKQQDSETQTDQSVPMVQPKPQVKKLSSFTETEENFFPVTNTVCPPPLYYNFKSHPENSSKKRTEQQERHQKKTSYDAGIHVDDVDFIYYKPDLLQPDGSTGCTSVCIQTDNVGTHQPVMSGQDSNQNVSEIEKRLNSEDLPLLSALLDELTSLRTKRQTLPAPVTKTIPTKVEDISQEKARPPIRPRECCLRVAAQKSALLKSKKKNQAVPKKVKFRPTNLTYGTTRTQLMRLELNQKGKVTNPRICDTGADNKKDLSVSAYSRERKVTAKKLPPEDFGKTHTIFTSPGIKEESVTAVSAGVQTDDVFPELAVPEPTSDSKKPLSENLGNSVIAKQQQKDDIQAEFGNNSTRSLASQNSLDIYLPQVQGDSDGSSHFGPGSDHASSDDVPLPELPTKTKYGHAGTHSPDLPEPIRRQSASPPIRSRTSTALSMYSDDFEESLIWEAKSQSDDNESEISSHTSSISHASENSQTKNKNVSNASSSSSLSNINDNYSQPIRSTFSPEKSRKTKERKRNVDQNDTVRSFEESKSDDVRTAIDTPDVNRESLFDSLNSPKSSDHWDDDELNRKDEENKSRLALPRPAIDLGYTY